MSLVLDCALSAREFMQPHLRLRSRGGEREPQLRPRRSGSPHGNGHVAWRGSGIAVVVGMYGAAA
jgi:hypothetical protein